MFLQAHIPTILAALIVTSLMLAVSLGYTPHGTRDSLGTWAFGLCGVAASFLLLALRSLSADQSLLAAGNLLLASGISLLLMAIRDFNGYPSRPAAAFAPVAVLFVGLVLTIDDVLLRIAVSNAIFAGQLLLACAYLLHGPTCQPGRGRRLAVAGIGTLAAVTAVRVWSVIFLPGSLSAFLQGTPIQSLTFFLALGGLVLATNGFAMMAKERSDERLRVAAMSDRLTQCWNRVRIEETASQEIARLRRYGHPVSAFIVDIDHFKSVNDQHGHGVGDEVLKAFAEVARRTLRATDILGRWGGEEFIAILPMSGIAEAATIAERLRATVETHNFPHGLRITVSIGLAACLTTDGWSEWLHRADTALYRAKSGGRNRVVTEGLEIVRRNANIGSIAIPQLVWRSGYLCGDETIDRQHRDLFDKANQLLVLSGEPESKARIVAALGEFLADTVTHFADEEKIIEAADYEDTLDHARTHRELLARSEDLLKRYEDGEIGAAALFHFVIHELFANHILAEDQTFSHLFRR